jgi:catechol 2,3-dioxygenase-like lactoylglutathione lyase family enzyme
MMGELKKKLISGIQQIGIGVENLAEAREWYVKHFHMDILIFDEEAVAEYMLHYTEGKPRARHAVLLMNLQGGGGFEVWQHTDKIPQKAAKDLILGDIGINICKMKSACVQKTYDAFLAEGLDIISTVKQAPDGRLHFFMRDPYGNIFQFVEDQYIFTDKNKYLNGGTYGAIIGVSNIEESLKVYQDILEYDKIVYDKTGVFEDLESLNGGEQQCRRLLLEHTKARKGAFSPVFGPTKIELIQIIDREPENIYDGRMWGDPGFIHICFDINGFNALKEECIAKGFPFTVDSTLQLENTFDMGDAAGDFAYISDPDGIPIEFVQTRKIALIKSIGWHIKLYKRNPEKALPRWMLKSMRFLRIKK